MHWFAFVAPVVAIALLARLEAILVRPYWSWIEMLPDEATEDAGTVRERRRSLWRRVTIPGVVCFVLSIGWPRIYDLGDIAIVGLGSAALLLWPIVFRGLPWGVSGWRLTFLYSSLVGSYAASSVTGGYIGQFARAQGLKEFFLDNLIGMIFGGVVTVVLTTVLSRSSNSAAKERIEVSKKT